MFWVILHLISIFNSYPYFYAIPCTDFDWFIRNGSLRKEYITQWNIVCFNLAVRDFFYCSSLHQYWLIVKRHIMRWIFHTEKKHTVFFLELAEIFRWNPQHQFWLIYTEWHIMEWLFYTYKPSVFYLNFWKFPGTNLIDLHGISH